MKTKVSFWKDEESSQIVNLEKGSKHTYESDLLSNTDTKSNSNCSEYLPTSDNESITSETSGMFPPLIKIHPKTYHIKKIILTKTGSMRKRMMIMTIMMVIMLMTMRLIMIINLTLTHIHT